MLALLKNTVFLIWLVGALASVSLGVSIWAFQATATDARLGVEATTITIKHRKAIAAAVMKVKAKARLKRMITMIPFAGAAAGLYFEEQEYKEWLAENPNESRSDYLCETAEITSAVLDEVLAELPAAIRPSKISLNDMMPKCEG